jgi:hypothetical protein
MKNGIICLMATLLFSINGLNAQCLQGKQSNQLRLYESTGVGKLDQLLNAEKRLLEEFFKVKTELKILNDSDAPNAYATDKSSNTFYFDGTVYLGYTLMADELQKRDAEGLSAIRGIMAHEYAHILQTKLDCTLEGSMRELHADFMAGWYMGIRSLYDSETSLKAFGESLFEKGDPRLWDAGHHGTPKKRLEAMLGGYFASTKTTDPEMAYKIGIELLTNGNDTGELKESTVTKKGYVAESKPTKVSIKSGDVVYDQIYSIEFTADKQTYYGLLMMNNGVGKMRLKFGNTIVEQRMSWLKLTSGEGVYQGFDPTDVATNTRLNNYRADNFYIIKGECWNVDDAGNKARVGAVELSSNDKAREWLTYLNW